MSRSASTAAGRRRSTARSPTGTRKPRPARGSRRAKPPPKRPSTKRAPARPAGRKRAASPPRRRTSGSGSARGRWLSWRGWTLLALVLTGAAIGGYFGWFRDSSLVAVTDVRVVGATSADSERIAITLRDAATEMTTLHFDRSELAAAVSEFPTVASIEVDAAFPHAMTIVVHERQPALVASAGGEAVPVAADGALLPTLPVEPAREAGLPELRLSELEDGPRLRGAALEQALVLAATPEPMRELVASTSYGDDYGVEVILEAGIELRFGSGAEAEAKWAAVTAVLADPTLTSLLYVDVREPTRPAVGGAG